MQTQKLFLIFALIAVGSVVAGAQHDDRKDPRSHNHDQKVNRVIEKHALLFKHPVPPPHHGKHHDKRHSKHKVWVTPRKDKHGHIVKGHWEWR